MRVLLFVAAAMLMPACSRDEADSTADNDLTVSEEPEPDSVPVVSHDLNRSWQRRDAILGLEVDWDRGDDGGIARIEEIDLRTLEQLVSENFIALEERQNVAPTVAEFLDFMRAHPRVKAHGYAVSPTREDYRVSLEGLFVAARDVTGELRDDFLAFCDGADELFIEDELYCWWA